MEEIAILCFNLLLNAAKTILSKSVIPGNPVKVGYTWQLHRMKRNISQSLLVMMHGNESTPSCAVFGVWSTCLHRHRWNDVPASYKSAVNIKYWHSQSIHTIAPSCGVQAVALAGFEMKKVSAALKFNACHDLFGEPLLLQSWQCQRISSRCKTAHWLLQQKQSRNQHTKAMHQCKPSDTIVASASVVYHSIASSQAVAVVCKVFLLNSQQVCSFSNKQAWVSAVWLQHLLTPAHAAFFWIS